MKNNSLKLFIFLISLIGLWVISSTLHLTLLWFIIMNLIAIYIICKYKVIDKKSIVISIFFSVLCMPSSIPTAISLVLPYIASMAIFKNSTTKIFLFKNGKKNNLITTIILIFVIGAILSAINVYTVINSIPINMSFTLKWIFDALHAGIFEEIFFRLFFFALCIHITKDNPLSKFQNIICYLIMVIPHVLIHFNLQTFNIGSFVVLSFLFGLPFALMQRKSNLVSAIGAHSLVDIVRFCIFGV